MRVGDWTMSVLSGDSDIGLVSEGDRDGGGSSRGGKGKGERERGDSVLE